MFLETYYFQLRASSVSRNKPESAILVNKCLMVQGLPAQPFSNPGEPQKGLDGVSHPLSSGKDFW